MATAAPAADAPKSGGGMKKLIIIGGAVALVLVIGGVGLMMYLSNKAKAEDAGGDDTPAATQPKKKSGEPPVFVPLDPFTVNLADKEVDRFAQIGVTLQVTDAHAGDDIKAYLPAIRSNVLVLLSHKTSADLLSVEGKEKLAEEVKHQANIAMGIEDDFDEEAAASDAAPPAKKKKKKHASESPIAQVLFSSFIVQ
ncbi:MAG: flagellar basal body-associated FliL family protein [Pelomonas sp.]|nr:flagellar basal body-associated FliL family protein [Roseateles sp.]